MKKTLFISGLIFFIAISAYSQTFSRWTQIPRLGPGKIIKTKLANNRAESKKIEIIYGPVPAQSIKRIIKRKFKETYIPQVNPESLEDINISKATLILEEMRIEGDKTPYNTATESKVIGTIASKPETLF